MDNFDFYISSDGYLIISEYNIKYLIDFYESNIPSMPEASESTVRVAGRDGDIVLNTTYEPISFEIVCYTEDNLTPEEKIQEETKINQFLNSIKNDTIPFGMQKDEKFYDVKYTGNLTTSRFPKHIKFSIPLKSSNPYAKYYLKREETGNVSFDSDTVKDAGALFIIEGPATQPKISFNNYEMYYEGTVAADENLEIDSSNSTVTLVKYPNTRTNAMRYYNHQFPKVKAGTNKLQLESGLETGEQIHIQWYDLKL